jgi:SAM-dependent methyltransferase
LDRSNYNNDDADFEKMTTFHKVDLATNPAGLGAVPEGYFDAILMAHVIEHLPNGLDIVRRLAGKLRPGGRIYIEYPGKRSLSLPSMRGSLNFCDDSTHVRVYDVRELANALLAERCRILSAGIRRDWPRALITPGNFLYQWVRDGSPSGVTLWDALGFAEYVYAQKRPEAGS